MASLAGFALGGLSDTLTQGLQRNQQADFQQQELKLQQQGQQLTQQRFQQAQYMALYNQGVQHMADFFEQWKLAHPDGDIKQAAAAMAPTKDNLKQLLKNLGQNPDSIEGLWAGMIAAPSKAETIQAEAKAKETPSLVAERESMAKYRQSLADPFGLEGGGGTGTVAPPGSNTFKPGETLGGSSVENIPPGAPLPIGGTQTAQATPAVPSGQGQKGDAFLATLPPKTAAAIKAVGDYEMDPTSLLSRGTLQARTQFLGLVKEYNPDFDVKEYKARAAAVQDFSKGPTARSIQSFNTLTTHLDLLGETVTALKNGDVKSINALKNAWQEQTGQTMPTDFEGVKTIVGDELVKAILGSGGALGDREAAQKSLDRANSPAQLNSLIDKYQKLAGGQLEGFRKRYESTTGRKDFDRYLLPSAKRQFQTGGSDTSGGISGSSGNVRFSFTPGQ